MASPIGEWLARRRPLVLGVAFVVPSVVIAVSVVSIVRDSAREPSAPSAAATTAPPSAAPSALAPSPAPSPVQGVAAAPSPSAVPPASSEAPLPEFLDATDDGEPVAPKAAAPKTTPPKRYTSVREAAAESCTTASVEGLSRQIIEQARCLKPNAFVPLPPRPNLIVADNVFPFLELGARDHLLRALDANPTRKMTLNSALRTVAQQYLVSRWAAGKRCGVQLATPPGESNHELGTALDLAEPTLWRAALESHDFHWLGASDRVHFDYKAKAPPPASMTDVLAFQILWNKNNAADWITADGRYTRATEQRLAKAPPMGFAVGPGCAKALRSKRP